MEHRVIILLEVPTRGSRLGISLLGNIDVKNRPYNSPGRQLFSDAILVFLPRGQIVFFLFVLKTTRIIFLLSYFWIALVSFLIYSFNNVVTILWLLLCPA